MPEIVHLHVHSEESVLDGLSKVDELVKRAKEIGSRALALTDHGTCAGIPDFIEACRREGIKPLPGCEVYMTRDREKKGEFLKEYRLKLCDQYKVKEKDLKTFMKDIDRNPDEFEAKAKILLSDYLMESSEVQGNIFDWASNNLEELSEEDKVSQFKHDVYDYLSYQNYHLLLLPVNNEGLEDLYKITSDAYINGFYFNPRTDLAYIRKHNLGKNIIATSACLGGWFAKLSLAGRMDEAINFIKECKDIFHSFYLEKQATRLPDQIKLNRLIDQIAKETQTPKVITTDVHYANKDDNYIHDILVASATKKCISDEDRLKYPHEFWMKSPEEIMEIEHDPEAMQNTIDIAEQVDVTLPEKPLFPKFIPENDEDDVETLLKNKTWNALFRYAIEKPIDLETYAGRLQYELDTIISLGFADYFLIVSDFIKAAKNEGIHVGPGRGSAAGSLVAFLLGITEPDPIEYNLMFERFLNPERAGYPDIDVDFPYSGARFVQNYLKSKYGEDKVAQIGTKGTLAARAACRLIGKTLGYDLATQDKFAKSIPDKPGIKLEEAYKSELAVQSYARQYPEWWKAMLALEGHVRSVGVHAGGIVLSPEPLTKTVPLRTDKEGLVTTQFDMTWIEKLLVKFDVLKLDTLDLIKQTMKNAGLLNFNINKIDLNDPKIYEEVYRKLNLSGIFQCESQLFQDIIKELQPNCFEDISVIVALGRPGPLDLIPSYIRRKFGQEKVEYPFPELEPVLKDTYGIWVYQEQIMEASVILGGFTRGQSDILRKAIGKKKMDLMKEWIDYMIYGSEEKGIEGAIKRGFDEKKLLKLKDEWIKFGEYCFNKSHSVCYAMLSVQTAWLKTYYPKEFMAALMTISEGKKDKNSQPKNAAYMKECERMGIKILPPDINESQISWTPVDLKDEEYPLGAIRFGLGSIAFLSNESGAIEEIIRCRPYRSVEDLVKKASSKINKTKVIALIKSGAFDSINGNRNLLWRNYMKERGEDYELIPAKTTKRDILSYEKEFLGSSVTVKSRWEGIPDGKENVTLTGFITQFETFHAKKDGKEHARIMVETQEDDRQVLVFNWLLEKHREKLVVGQKVQIRGKKSGEDMLANNIQYPNV